MAERRGPMPKFDMDEVPAKYRRFVMQLHGQPYMTAAGLLLMLRDEHPDWAVETYLIEYGDKHAIFRAVVSRPYGEGYTPVGTGHAMETVQGFADFLPKAETSAIRRAIINAGVGVEYLEDEGVVSEAPVKEKEDEAPRERTPEEEAERQARIEAYNTAMARLKKIARAVNRGTDNQALTNVLYEYLPEKPRGTRFTTTEINFVASELEKELTG